jgi:hypothetical protein
MIYFSLSPTDIANYKHICGIFHSTEINDDVSTIITPSVHHYLDEIHGLMENHSEKDRHTYQKYTNPGEFIGNSIPNKQYPVAKYRPFSNTYFHMIELMHEFHLIDKALNHEETGHNRIQTIHLSNDPGCIEATINVRRGLDTVAQQQEQPRTLKQKTPIILPLNHPPNHPPNRPFFGKRFGFGALSDSDSDDDDTPIAPIVETEENVTEECIPVDTSDDQDSSSNQDTHIFTSAFPHNDFLQRNPQIRVDTQVENLVQTYNMGSMDFITGMAQKDTENDDEVAMLPVLWSQVLNALQLQKPGKSFVMRVKDCFHLGTLDLLYILTMFYREVHVVKLMSSSAATSEKYIVCQGYTSAFTPEIRDHLEKVDGEIKGKGGSPIRRFLDFDLPSFFLKKMEDCNVVFGKQQIETIQHTLALIDKRPRADKLDLIVRKNVTQCIEWCQTYHIPVNHIGGMGTNRYK